MVKATRLGFAGRTVRKTRCPGKEWHTGLYGVTLFSYVQRMHYLLLARRFTPR